MSVTASSNLVAKLRELATFMSKHDDGICRMEAECPEEAIETILALEADKAALVEALRGCVQIFGNSHFREKYGNSETYKGVMNPARTTLAKHEGAGS